MKSRGIRLLVGSIISASILSISSMFIRSKPATAKVHGPLIDTKQYFYPLGSLIQKNPDCDRMIVPNRQVIKVREYNGPLSEMRNSLSLPNLLFGLSLDLVRVGEDSVDEDRLDAEEMLFEAKTQFYRDVMYSNALPELIIAGFLNDAQFDANKPIEDFATIADFFNYYGESAQRLFEWLPKYFLSMASHVVQHSDQFDPVLLDYATRINEGTLSTLDAIRNIWDDIIKQIYDVYNKAYLDGDGLMISWQGLEEHEVSIFDITWEYIDAAYNEVNSLTINDFLDNADKAAEIDELSYIFTRINENDLVSEWTSRRGVLNSDEAKEYYRDNFQTSINASDSIGGYPVGAIERYCVSRGRTFNYEAQFDESWDPSWGGTAHVSTLNKVMRFRL